MKSVRVSYRLMKKNLNITLLMILAVVGCLIYGNTFNNPFIFDDVDFIVNGVSVHDLGNLKLIWQRIETRFISMLVFAFNYHFFGLEVTSYHVINILIHIFAAIAVFYLFKLIFSLPSCEKYLTGNGGNTNTISFIAFVGALIFITHPLQTQAVTYISQRMASLVAFFYILSCYLYLKARTSTKTITIVRCFGLLACTTVLGMFTKENFFTMPVMILMLEIYFVQKKFSIQTFKNISRPLKLFLLFVFLSMLIIPSSSRFDLSNTLFHVVPSRSHVGDTLTVFNYPLTQLRVVSLYIGKLFLPINQNLFYDFKASNSLFEGTTFLCFLFIFGLIILTFKLFKNHRLLSFGIMWFFLTIAVESSILPIRYVIFEHRVYLPMVGFSLIVSVGIFKLIKNVKLFAIVACLIASVLSVLTINRNKIWQDEVVFWEDVVKKTPHQTMPYDNLAAALMNRNDYQKALAVLKEANKIDQNVYERYNNLGLIYMHLGKFAEAEQSFKEVLKHKDEVERDLPAVTYNNLGTLYLKSGKPKMAREMFVQSIKTEYTYLQAYLNLGRILHEEGNYEKALLVFKEANNKYPYDKYSANAIIDIYLRMGKKAEALNSAGRFLTKIDDPQYLVSIGTLLIEHNIVELGSKYFYQALKLDKRYPDAYIQMGKILANAGQINEALDAWNQGYRYNPNDGRFPALINKAHAIIAQE